MFIQQHFTERMFPISPGYYRHPKRNPRQWLCNILGDKQGALSGLGEIVNCPIVELIEHTESLFAKYLNYIYILTYVLLIRY